MGLGLEQCNVCLAACVTYKVKLLKAGIYQPFVYVYIASQFNIVLEGV